MNVGLRAINPVKREELRLKAIADFSGQWARHEIDYPVPRKPQPREPPFPHLPSVLQPMICDIVKARRVEYQCQTHGRLYCVLLDEETSDQAKCPRCSLDLMSEVWKAWHPILRRIMNVARAICLHKRMLFGNAVWEEWNPAKDGKPTWP